MMNFTETPSVKVPREFLAVILAGFGSELQPLTSSYGDQPCPKALLPIGNKPMISYVLNWVEEAGLRDVLLICPTTHRDAISHHIHSDPSSSSLSSATTGLQVDIQTFDQEADLPAGTASVLAHFANKIEGDFVLLPCDFIPPKALRLEAVLDNFRVEASTDGALATALFFEKRATEHDKSKGGGSLEEAWPADDPPPAVLYDEKSGTLLHVDTLDDRDRNGDELELRMATLWRYPRSRLTTKLVDAHVYVCRHAVLEALQLKKDRLDSIREEFLPWLCKVATHRTKQRKYGRVLNPITNASSQTLALQHSTSHPPNLKAKSKKDLATVDDSAPPSPSLDDDVEDVAPPSMRVGLLIHRASEGLALRAHTVSSYLELNRAALISVATAAAAAGLPTPKPSAAAKTPKPNPDGALIDPKASVGVDCLIGASTHVGERTAVKRTAIGSHCVIGKGAKLVGCVLMEYCIIEDGAKLDGCILGKNTKVGAKAELVRCITQAGYEVEPGGVYKHERLEISDWAAGTAEPDDEDEDGDEDDGGDSEEHDDEGEESEEETDEED